jgi:hypothetical protein
MPFQLPDDITGLTAEQILEKLQALPADQLQKLLDDGLDEFNGLGLRDNPTREALDRGKELKPQLTYVSNALKAQKVQQAADAADAAALLEGVDTLNVTDPEPAPATDDTPTDPAPAATEPGDGTADAPLPVEVVPASASPSGKSPARAAAANSAPPTLPARRKSSYVANLTAAADVPGFALGQQLEGLDAVVQGIHSRFQGMQAAGVGRGAPGPRAHYPVASIRLGGWDEETIQRKDGSNDMLLPWIAQEHKLEGGSLTAAGGWCAPSQTLYDLCQYETVQGILDMPEMQITRGGIRWTPGPDFSDIYNTCGFHQTETQAEAGTAKTCCEVDCPEFDEIRLEVEGLCITSPLLTEVGYPELTRRFLEGALVAYEHKKNAFIINEIAAAAGTALTLTGTAPSTTWSINQLEMQAVGMRDRWRLAFDSSIEVVAPFWLKAAIRADWGMQAWPREASDAAINRWFADRNLAIQWVYDWQPLFNSGCNTVVPDTVDVLMYPAGSWTRGRANVINISAVYDTAGLTQNQYTALFVEEGILAVQRCLHTCRLRLQLCASGRVGAADSQLCASWFGDQDIATTAVAGAPGSFTPTGDIKPGDYWALVNASPAIVASPTTAWTTGQHIVLGDGDHAYWDGNSWELGDKPA